MANTELKLDTTHDSAFFELQERIHNGVDIRTFGTRQYCKKIPISFQARPFVKQWLLICSERPRPAFRSGDVWVYYLTGTQARKFLNYRSHNEWAQRIKLKYYGK